MILKNKLPSKNGYLMLVILLALLLIAIVFWVFEKRINRIDSKMETATLTISN